MCSHRQTSKAVTARAMPDSMNAGRKNTMWKTCDFCNGDMQDEDAHYIGASAACDDCYGIFHVEDEPQPSEPTGDVLQSTL